MRHLKADLSAIAMSVLAKPEIQVTSFLSLDHKDNVRILLDASTVSQILKLGRSLLVDVVSVQLAEQQLEPYAPSRQTFPLKDGRLERSDFPGRIRHKGSGPVRRFLLEL